MKLFAAAEPDINGNNIPYCCPAVAVNTVTKRLTASSYVSPRKYFLLEKQQIC
jgi:hypothetical protein